MVTGYYLGRYDLPQTREAYHRLLAEWIANGRTMPVAQDEITVMEVIAKFWDYAKGYYVEPDGKPSQSIDGFRAPLRELKQLYGRTNAAEFGPRALKTIRQRFIEAGNCRNHVNEQVGRIKMVLRWAVSEELIPATIIHALDAVSGLKRGRTGVRESEPVKPVPEAHITAIQTFVSRQVWALIQLQLFCAARPGELVIMRPVDIETATKVWRYHPVTHKTAYRDRPRTIYFGPRAQKIIREFLIGRSVVSCLFSPLESESERRTAMHSERKTPVSCGNKPGSNCTKTPKRKPGERYTTDSYRRAIQRSCELAGVPQWSPNQLRHNAGSKIRKEFGLEAAQIMLGHSKADVTQLYAEVNEQKGIQIASNFG